MMRYIFLLLAAFVVCSESYVKTSRDIGIDKASVKILKEAHAASGADSNVIISPLGIILLLALYSSGTEGESRNEIMTLLGSSNYQELTKSYTVLSATLGLADANFTLANKIYIAKGFTLQEKFLNTALSYNSDVEPIDFTNAQSAADIINQWAAEKTRGHITKPVNQGGIDPTAVVALFNVIFFQGHWNVPFKLEDTKDRDFYMDKNTIVKKPMMYVKAPLLHYDDKEIGARLVEIPYNETSFRMVVFLPHEKDGLHSVLEKVAKKGLLDQVFSMMKTAQKPKVNLYMPKFEIRNRFNLVPIMKKVGVSGIFNPNPGARGIAKESSVSVSDFFQEAFVKVDEEGSTAGAVTGMISFTSGINSLLDEVEFKVDHPFLFAILHENVVIFTGVYSQ